MHFFYFIFLPLPHSRMAVVVTAMASLSDIKLLALMQMQHLWPMSSIRLCLVALDAPTPGLGPLLMKLQKGFCLMILSRQLFSLLLIYHFLFLLHYFFSFLLISLDAKCCEHPASSAMTFCGLPSLWTVLMAIFWTSVQSAVFPIVYPTDPKWETLLNAQETFTDVLS